MPFDLSKSNRTLLNDIVNRGNKVITNWNNVLPASPTPADIWRRVLEEQGFIIAWSGSEVDLIQPSTSPAITRIRTAAICAKSSRQCCGRRPIPTRKRAAEKRSQCREGLDEPIKRASITLCSSARFAVAELGQRGDPDFETAGNLANVGLGTPSARISESREASSATTWEYTRRP
jgi:hypothetical protein